MVLFCRQTPCGTIPTEALVTTNYPPTTNIILSRMLQQEHQAQRQRADLSNFCQHCDEHQQYNCALAFIYA